MRKLIIIGNGKLADIVLERFPLYSNLPVVPYSSNISCNEQTVFVHMGSGREYQESLESALKGGASYIQAATEKDYKMPAPKNPPIAFIHAPNLDLNIVKLFSWLKAGALLFGDEKITVTESHQKEKTSQPGTAFKICDYLGLPREKLVSVRDPDKQKALGIKTLHHHAYHRIQIGEENSGIRIETKVEGAESYVKGLAKIVTSTEKLTPGLYEIDDILPSIIHGDN